MHSSSSTRFPPRSPIRELAEEIRLLTSVRRDFQKQTAGTSYTFASLSVLGWLERAGLGRVRDVASGLGVDASVASRQIAQLAADGLVDRSADPHDARSHVLSVTPRGREALAGVRAQTIGRWSRALDSWSDDDLLALSSSLRRLRDDLADAGLLTDGEHHPTTPTIPTSQELLPA